tara:strand:+ start:1036 stop:1674 length:639 start_codon:yes stop_codon:yes gene_type:complete
MKWFVIGILCILATVLGTCHAKAEPQASLPYKRDVIRESRAVWGLDAPVALFAGQIEQESAWREKVCSPFACGLAQFTPSTAEWISGAYPSLGKAEPFNAQWAIRSLVRYDYHIHSNMAFAVSDCDRWAFTLSGYNGGAGWIARDRLLCDRVGGCDADRWFANVEYHSRRADWALKENRGYPKRILFDRQFHYTTWGRTITCPGASQTPSPK